MNYKLTKYFEEVILKRRPYLKIEWCIKIIENPIKVEKQEENRYKFWVRVPEFGNRIFRVITLEDKITIHNAFPDRSFRL
ncbi:MAG: hypothetical protein ACE5KZ_05315 [Candidatus Scalinduaceae bacterium]